MHKFKDLLSRKKSRRGGSTSGPADFQTGGQSAQRSKAHEPLDSKAPKIEHEIDPPPYAENSELKSSKQAVIDVFEDSLANHYLDDVATRNQRIIVDDNFRLGKTVRDTIRLSVHLVQLCHVGLHANSMTTFMSYSNPESVALMEVTDRDVMEHLEALFETTSRDEAGKTIQAFTTLDSDPRIQAVNEKFKKLDAWAKQDRDVAHEYFLDFVREQKAAFHYGWKTSEIIGERFDELYDAACNNTKKQEACLNSLAFNLKHTLNTITYLRAQGLFHPTNFIFFSGSKLANSEVTQLRKLLNTATKGMTADEKSEISIQVIACWNHDKSSINGHKELDDHKKGDQDIYDCTSVSSDILFGGPGKLFLGKIHNSYRKEWDTRDYALDEIVDHSRAGIVRKMKEVPGFAIPGVSDIHFP